jgi:fatty-acyl-CoA synthase
MTELPRDTGGMAYAFGVPLSKETGIGPLTLGSYLRAVTDRFAPREAAVLHQDERVERWTYQDLWNRSVDVSRALIGCDIGKGTRVGILMTNRPEFLACVFGAALAGCVATTISTFFTATELDEVLKASCCSVLLFEREVLKKDFAASLTELEPRVTSAAPGQLASTRFPFLRHLAAIDLIESVGAIEGWRHFLARGQRVSLDLAEATASTVMPSDPGTLFFSSGSTGKAKGILSAHRGVCLQLWRWKSWYGIEEPPRTWSSNGFFFSGNFAMALGGTLSAGGSLVLQRYFHAETALWLMERERATMLLAWPHQWAQLQAASNYATVNLSSMRYIDAESPIARHPSISTHWREPAHAYGSTETFTLISVFPAGTPASIAGKSHGVPTAGSVIKVVDPISGTPVRHGVRGEIAVKGPTLMLGYIGIPLDESLDDEGFFRTSDGGYLDEAGRLFWEGRLNDIIKTGGANVSALEIDQVIRDCPGVKISQTVGVAHELLGEIVVACVVPHAEQMLTEEFVRDFARKRLASYKVPRRVLFFAEHELKTTGSAKIVTAELRKIASARIEAGPSRLP